MMSQRNQGRGGILPLLADLWAIIRLRFGLAQYKVARYDDLAQQVQGLRRALRTQQANRDQQRRRQHELECIIDDLHSYYQTLKTEQDKLLERTRQDAELAFFQDILPVLVQLPSVRQALMEGAELTPGDIMDIVAPLEAVLAERGFAAIGRAGESTTYDGTRHRAVGRGARSVVPGDPVRVRYVGYTYKDEVVCKAEVMVDRA